MYLEIYLLPIMIVFTFVLYIFDRLFFILITLQVELMQRTVEKSLEYETNRNGLIILKALYGRLATQDG